MSGIIALVLLSGCGSTRIFRANFEADTIGALPAENPPGEPEGDLFWTSVGDAPAALSVAPSGELSSKSLRYANVNLPLYRRFVGFFSKEVSLAPDKTFYAYWSGRVYSDASGSALQLYLGNSHFLPIALLEFKNGNIRIQTSSGSVPTFETVGVYTPGSSHFILITVDKAATTYQISIIQHGGTNINTGVRPVLNLSALNTNRPTLYLFYNEEAHGTGRYFIDDVIISEKEPEMPR